MWLYDAAYMYDVPNSAFPLLDSPENILYSEGSIHTLAAPPLSGFWEKKYIESIRLMVINYDHVTTKNDKLPRVLLSSDDIVWSLRLWSMTVRGVRPG